MTELDAYDVRLLAALQDDARMTSQQLSDRVHLSPSQCHRRQRRLEAAGVVTRYVARLRPESLGLGVMALVNVSLEQHGRRSAERFGAAVVALPQVLECWAVSGDADYVLKVAVADLRGFNSFLMDRLLVLPEVRSVRSAILLDCLKDTTALPLPER